MPEATRRLAVFSHPNHELALFGLVGRLRPHLLFLTDGGGSDRVAQTRQGLAALSLLERARFLDFEENQLYGALLDGDDGFLAGIADRVRETLDELRPHEIWCDAVEFYNPVHDLAVPVVRSALAGADGARLFEVPLIYQRNVDGERYAVQRFPEGADPSPVRFELTASEADLKRRARDEIYTLLRDQMGPVLCDLPQSHLGVEEIRPAPDELTAPGDDRRLRYEWRGERLLARGEVERVITYRDHYLPCVTRLMAA